jgi:hypothetical protein
MRGRRVVAVACVAMTLAGCGSGPAQPRSPEDSGPAVLAQAAGATLRRDRLADGSAAYVQRIDLRTMRVDQVLGDRDSTKPAVPGSYYPGADSPRFRRITAERMQDSCRSRYGAAAFSAVNFSFFEEYDPSTRLSFPVKAGGAVVSGGSSPYGPVPAPASAYYRTVTLKALSWNDHAVSIGPYDPAGGAPLNQPAVRDGLVTYAYRDHPAYALGKDPANRYQLAGAVDTDGRDGTETLVVVTVEHTTLDAAAQLLRANGVQGDIVTFDGGISTYLWSAAGGTLVPATSKDGALPHYLCVHAAG